VPGRFAAAKQAGATDDELSETLMYAMRGRARAAWSTIKYIPDIEDKNKEWKTVFEREHTRERP
jgi:alkylhydroperoxidase/carboxymuconolactone decarboxylase family protein YurZ